MLSLGDSSPAMNMAVEKCMVKHCQDLDERSCRIGNKNYEGRRVEWHDEERKQRKERRHL